MQPRARRAAATPHMEGALLFLLSGAYTGFLPDHYTGEWVRPGRLRGLAPEADGSPPIHRPLDISDPRKATIQIEA